MSALTIETHSLISQKILALLVDKKIYTIFQFVKYDSHILSHITKLTFKDILLIKKQIIQNNSATIHSALDSSNKMLNNKVVISSYYSNLDKILNGGFHTGNLYEICTVSSPLRTKFVYKFLVQYTIENQINNSENKVIFYDTKNGFNTLYMKYINEHLLYQAKNYHMNNLLIQQTTDIYKLIEALYKLKDELLAKSIKLKLIVIDSLPPTLYYTTKIDKFNMMLNSLISVIRYVMIEFHVCFIVTNLLIGNVDYINESSIVSGGKYWQNLPNFRLKIVECNYSNKHIVHVIKDNQECSVDQKCEIEI